MDNSCHHASDRQYRSHAVNRARSTKRHLGAQWDVTHQVWRAYLVAPNTDWWTAFYPGDNMQRPTGTLCDGCHSVNYNIQTRAVTEWNVGCEKCHGPGSEHAQRPSRANIVNPARLNY